MRINNNVMALNTHRMYAINTGSVQKATEKLSSGYRINRAGDDAAGLAISEKMRAQIRGLKMASKNSSDAVSLVKTAEAALQETHNVLQRMRELAVQSRSDTNETSIDRAALDAEFQQLIKEIDDTAAKTRFNDMGVLTGEYQERFLSAEAQGALSVGFFSRANELSTVFAFAIRNVQTEKGMEACAEITYEGYTAQVFAGENYAKLDNIELLFDPLMGNGTLKAVTFTQGQTYADGDVQAAASDLFLFHADLYRTFVDKAYTPSGAVVVPGGFTSGLNAAATNAFNTRLTSFANAEKQAAINAVRPGFYTAAYAVEWQAVYDDAYQSAETAFMASDYGNAYNQAATVFDSTQYATVYGQAAAAFDYTNAYDDAAVAFDYTTTYTGYVSAYDPAVHLGYSGANDYATQMADADQHTYATGIADTAKDTYATGIADTAKDTYATSTATAARTAYATNAANTGVTAGARGIIARANATADVQAAPIGQAAYDAAMVNTSYIQNAEAYAAAQANAYLRNNMHRLTSGTPQVATGSMDITVTEGKALTIQSGANQGDEALINIDRMDAWHLGVAGESIATGKKARQAIRFVNNAINRVSMQRAHLGAMQNRLEHKIQNLDGSAENLSAAESRIRDLDMAAEMTNFTRNNILQQASTAMLAQANTIPRRVLQLIS